MQSSTQYNRGAIQLPNQYQQSFGSSENLSMNGNYCNAQPSFTNAQGCDEYQARGTTRVVCSDGRCATFSNGNENYPNCIIQGGVIMTSNNGGTFQQQQEFGHNHNTKPFYQQNQFRNQNQSYAQQNYVQRPHTQTRYVRIQGSKKKSHFSFRNFGSQNQNRRFAPKNFNYKMQRALNFCPTDNVQHNSVDLQEYRQVQQDFVKAVHSNNDAWRKNSEKLNGGIRKKKYQKTVGHSKSPKGTKTLSKPQGQKARKDANSMKLLVPKVEVDCDSPLGPSSNLTYDDVSEADSDEDYVSKVRDGGGIPDKKKEKVVVKREPGEIDSDEDEADEQEQVSKNFESSEKNTTQSDSKNAESKKKEENDTSKKSKKSPASATSSKSESQTRKSDKRERPGLWNTDAFRPCHDDRFTAKKDGSSVGCAASNGKGQAKADFSNKSSGSSPGKKTGSETAKEPCCTGEDLADLEEQVEDLKRLLRDARDQLLESKVVGSKTSLRLQNDLYQVKRLLVDKEKAESKLKLSLKTSEEELAVKIAELAKMTLLCEAEKQEKVKFQVDLSRTYQDRLLIETEKLRALFDVEVAKMKAYYLSQTLGYDDGSYFRNGSENPTRNRIGSPIPNQIHFNPVNDDGVKHKNTCCTSSTHVVKGPITFPPPPFYNLPPTPYFERIGCNNSSLFGSEGQGRFSASTGYCSANNIQVIADTDSRISGTAFTFFGSLASSARTSPRCDAVPNNLQQS